MRSKLAAAAIIILALFGGTGLYYSRPVLGYFIAAAFVIFLVAAGVIFRGKYPLPAALWPLCLLTAAAIVSGLANLALAPVWLSRVYLAFLAIAVLVIAHRYLAAHDILAALRQAGALWPFIWLAARLAGWDEHQNIISFYSVVFLLAALSGPGGWPQKLLVLAHAAMLTYFAGRGALIAAGVGVAVLLWPFILRRHWPVYGALLLAGSPILFYMRPHSAMVRLSYWQNALKAWLNSIWLGLGPGGLWATHAIIEGSNFRQIHAHNILITTLAETGLIGLMTLLVVAASLLTLRYSRFQAALGLGLAAWSMVDEPLFWAGPLLVSAVVFSSLKHANTHPAKIA
jgi:hypothetical protein